MPSRSAHNSLPVDCDRKERGTRARARGASGEEVAVAFLQSKGARILHRNWRPQGANIRGECDIVAQIDSLVCFVEVKTRQSSNFGEPQEFVGPDKRRQMERLARAWIALHGDEQSLRFDIIEIWWIENANPRVAWIEGAFEVRI